MKFIEAIEKYTYNQQIVLDGLIDDKSVNKLVFCPFCLSLDVKLDSGGCTCVGGTPDPNHYWRTGQCNMCGNHFNFEHHLWRGDYKSTNVWYTESIDKVNIPYKSAGSKFDKLVEDYKSDKIVRVGISNCCENSSFYECNCDGGLVKLIYTKLDGVTITHSLGWSRDTGKDYRSFVICNICGLKVEIDDA